jgi:hypothetical protein
MGSIKRKLLCVGVVALLLLGLVGSGVAVSTQAHKGDNNGLNGGVLGNGQQEQVEQETQNARENKTIQTHQKEEVKAVNNGTKGQALGNGQQEQVEQETQNMGENKTIRVQQKEEVRALNNGSKGLAPGQVKKEIPQLAAIKAPITVLHKAQGFALNESSDEFHVLRTSIIRVRRVQPMHMRDLMEANKSIEDIKAEITEADWVPFYKGSLRLGEHTYNLVNISVNETGDNLTFSADLVDPLVDSESSETVGSIEVAALNYEGVRIADGTLAMYKGDYPGEYRVLLIVHPIQALVRTQGN